MSNYEAAKIRLRIEKFAKSIDSPGNALSIKIRPVGGCFHREHSREAYKIIDGLLKNSSYQDIVFEEHESGPELLVWLAIGAAGLSLAKSVVELVTEIIKARHDGIHKWDSPQSPLELILRRTDKKKKIEDIAVLRIDNNTEISKDIIEKAMLTGIEKLFSDNKSNDDEQKAI